MLARKKKVWSEENFPNVGKEKARLSDKSQQNHVIGKAGTEGTGIMIIYMSLNPIQ